MMDKLSSLHIKTNLTWLCKELCVLGRNLLKVVDLLDCCYKRLRKKRMKIILFKSTVNQLRLSILNKSEYRKLIKLLEANLMSCSTHLFNEIEVFFIFHSSFLTNHFLLFEILKFLLNLLSSLKIKKII